VSLGVVRLVRLDAPAGTLTIDAPDALDGTPVLDIKPWFGATELPQD
jgi:tRNA (Thr-GGU) A37 N-methylase